MALQSNNIQRIALENLFIDLKNPRYDPITSQREALATIAVDQGAKLVSLAEDIVEKGLNPSELPIVTPADDNETTYIVVEGNRRIAALKLISSPSLVASIGLSSSLKKRYRELHDSDSTNLPRQIDCVILDREDANHWILLKHTGENDGLGVVTWDGAARHRFRGSSPALQAIELVAKSDYLDDETKGKLAKIAITNIERILGTPAARQKIGVDVKNGQLELKIPEEEAIARLAIIVSDVANKVIKVPDLENKDQRIGYAEDVASRPLPKAKSFSVGRTASAGSKATKGIPTTSSSSLSGPKRISPDRNTLIPRRFRLAISQTRINQIYHELQKLRIDQYANSIAVLFRVFVELSIDDYGQRHSILFKVPGKVKTGSTVTPPDREMTLREKITSIVDYLDNNTFATKAELKGIRTLVSNRDHVLSVDSLNAYVHNKDYSPTPADLKGNWDSIQAFIERVWTT